MTVITVDVFDNDGGVDIFGDDGDECRPTTPAFSYPDGWRLLATLIRAAMPAGC
jgi:hypothetical protein